jgi:hypothetical protein
MFLPRSLRVPNSKPPPAPAKKPANTSTTTTTSTLTQATVKPTFVPLPTVNPIPDIDPTPSQTIAPFPSAPQNSTSLSLVTDYVSFITHTKPYYLYLLNFNFIECQDEPEEADNKAEQQNTGGDGGENEGENGGGEGGVVMFARQQRFALPGEPICVICNRFGECILSVDSFFSIIESMTIF